MSHERIHDVVDIERWTTLFSLVRLRAEAHEFVLARQQEQPERYADQAAVDQHIGIMMPAGEAVGTPRDLAIVEQLRAETLESSSTVERVPVDVFIWAKGEPPRRDVTKFGGLPYRPASAPWPQTDVGSPLTFVGQFCFADSRDLIGDLPGDVLLVFMDPDAAWDDDDSDSGAHVEWQPLGLTDLIAADAVPPTEWTLLPLYGQIHRTYDIVDGARALGHLRRWEQIARIEGTKIGGLPVWVQYDEEIPGRYICAFGSISSNPYHEFTFTNVEQPYGWADAAIPQWGDAGSLYFFVDEHGQTCWTMQSY